MTKIIEVNQNNEAESVKDKVARADHDSLIRIETVVVNIATDLKSLADGTAQRISSLESNKLDVKNSFLNMYKVEVDRKIDSHEERVANLERINEATKPHDLLMTVTEHDRQIREARTTIKNLNWVIGGSFLGFVAIISWVLSVSVFK